MKIYMICSMVGGFPIAPIAFTTYEMAFNSSYYNDNKHSIRQINVITEETGKDKEIPNLQLVGQLNGDAANMFNGN